MGFTKVSSGGISTSQTFVFSNVDTVGVVTASTVQVGSATTIHTTGIDLGGGTLTSHNINSTGVITATSFSGDGSGLTGVAAAGLGSALSDDTNSPLNLIYKTPKVLNVGAVGAALSITVESDEVSGYVAYMPTGSVHIAVGSTVRVAAGTTVKTNILGVFD